MSRRIAYPDAARLVNSKEVEAYFERANLRERRGQHRVAIDDYSKVLRRNPDYLDAYINRGYSWQALGQYARAILDFDAALARKPDLALAYLCRADVEVVEAKHAEAMADYTKALWYNPIFIEAYINRGKLKRLLGQHREALADFEAALNYKPDLTEAHFLRADAIAASGLHAEAIAEYTKLLLSNSEIADLYVKRACSQYKQSAFREAIADCDKALAIDPKIREAYMCRANSKRQLKDYPAAIADYNLVLSDCLSPSPFSNAAWAFAGRACAKNAVQKYASAIEDCNEAIWFKPDLKVAYRCRADAHFYLEHFEEAIDDYRAALALDPEDAQQEIIKLNLIGVYIERATKRAVEKKFQLSVADLEIILDMTPPPDISVFVKSELDRLCEYAARHDVLIVRRTQISPARSSSSLLCSSRESSSDATPAAAGAGLSYGRRT